MAPIDPETLSTEKLLRRSLVFLVMDIRRLRRVLDRNQVDIDTYASDLGVTGIAAPQKQYNGPYIIESLLATWGGTAVTVTLTINDRIITLTPTLGFFNPQGMKQQVQRDDVVKLVVTPATAGCFLEVFGYADKRRIDQE